jgi:hypothetical protein
MESLAAHSFLLEKVVSGLDEETKTKLTTSVQKLVKDEMRKLGFAPRLWSPSQWWRQSYLPSRATSWWFVAGYWTLFSLAFGYQITVRLTVPLGVPLLGALLSVGPFIVRHTDSAVLLTFHVALTGAVFALMIFVAAALRDSATTDRGRVLLKASHLYPLVLAALLGYPVFLLRGENPWKILPPLALGFLMVLAVGDLLRILLYRGWFTAERREILGEMLKESIGKTTSRLLCRQHVYCCLRAEARGMTATPWPWDNVSLQLLPAGRSGVITDINLRLIGELEELIEHMANAKDETCRPDRMGAVAIEIGQLRAPWQHNPRCYLFKTVGDTVRKGDALVGFDQRFLGSQRLRDLERLCETAVSISEPSEKREDESLTLQFELGGLRESLITAAKERRPEAIERIAADYRALLTAVHDSFTGLRRADAERWKVLFGETESWAEVPKEAEWLMYDLRAAFERTAKEGDQDTADQISRLLVEAALPDESSLSRGPFRTFLHVLGWSNHRFPPLGSTLRLVEQVGRQLRDRMVPDVESSDADRSTAQEYSSDLLRFCQELARQAIYERKGQDFRAVISALDRLFAWEGRYYHRVPDEVRNATDEGKTQMRFGLAAWLFAKLQVEPDDKALTEMLEAVMSRLPSDLGQLTTDFLTMHNDDTVESWGWSRWDDGKVGWHPRPEAPLLAIARVYCLKALRVLAQRGNAKAQLPADARLTQVLSRGGSLSQVLAELKDEASPFRRLVSGDELGQLRQLGEMLSAAKLLYEQKGSQERQNALIDAQCVSMFREAFVSSFERAAWFWRLLQVEQSPDLPATVLRWGLNEITRKDEFLTGQNERARELGQMQGQSLGVDASNYLAGQVLEACKSVSAKSVTELLDQMPADVVILTGSIMFFEGFGDDLKDDWPGKSREAGQRWWFRYHGRPIPVFSVLSDATRNSIAVFSRGKLGKLVQYSPLNANENPVNVKDGFYVDVRALSNPDLTSVVNDLVDHPPDWLSRVGDAEAMRRHLRERAWLQAWLRVDLQDIDGIRFGQQDKDDDVR